MSSYIIGVCIVVLAEWYVVCIYTTTSSAVKFLGQVPACPAAASADGHHYVTLHKLRET